MPRAMWEGAVSFGLIVIPVKLYGATEPVPVRFWTNLVRTNEII